MSCLRGCIGNSGKIKQLSLITPIQYFLGLEEDDRGLTSKQIHKHTVEYGSDFNRHFVGNGLEIFADVVQIFYEEGWQRFKRNNECWKIGFY